MTSEKVQVAHAPDSNREPRKVNDKGSLLQTLLPGAPDPVIHPSPLFFPRLFDQGVRRVKAEEGSGFPLYVNYLRCYADEGSYANVCPPGRQARTLPSLTWGPGAGQRTPSSLGFPFSLPFRHLFSSPDPSSPMSALRAGPLSTWFLPCIKGLYFAFLSVPPFPSDGTTTANKHVQSTCSVPGCVLNTFHHSLIRFSQTL